MFHFGVFRIEPVYNVFFKVRLDSSLGAVKKDFSVQLGQFYVGPNIIAHC